MKLHIKQLITAVAILFLVAGCGSTKQSPEQQSNPKLATTFNWLLGQWEAKTGETNFYESWNMLDDSTLKAFSFMLKGSDTVFSENISLAYRMGKIEYIPLFPGEKPEDAVRFVLIDSTRHVFVFENKSHDFPQRIIYKAISQDSVLAWIEGNEKGKFRKEEFKLARKQ